MLEIRNFPPTGYACTEAINTLCTNLTFSGQHVRKIMLTSCQSSEGKSFLAMNIMRTMAKLGYRVALVEADLRRGAIASTFDFRFPEGSQRMGLTQYLAGMADINDVFYETNIPNTFIVPVGHIVSNSLQLLNSPYFPELLNTLAQHVDYLIVDAPPVGQIIDAAQIATSCDGVLIVVSYNRVHHQELVEVRAELEKTGCPILGAVLNNVEYNSYLNKKYYFKSYHSTNPYYEDEKHTGRKKLFSRKKKREE